MQGSSRHLRPRVTHWVCQSCQSRLLASQKTTRAFTTSKKRCANPSRRPKLPETPARTRFAPSPTGSLHLGSIRTALFNYLLAKRTGGRFLLRIEDTDQKRTVAGAEERLFTDLRWAGLLWDEGPQCGGPYGPYRQSERLFLYHTHIQTLLKNGSAYRCFCSVDRIDELNRLRHDKGLPLGYDRKCMDIPAEEAEARAARGDSNIIRFRVPKQYPKYNDLVYGKSGHGDAKSKQHLTDEPVFDDPVLIKADGFPTYHFANVVDDKLMDITHVIRGSEWISSTPLHVALYQALGWTPPQYGHVPLLVDHNRQKLSKRNFDSDISSFRDKQAIFPETLTNFAALLGWSHQQKSDVMDLAELENVFDLKITKGNTIVAFEKLNFLQEKHAQRKIQARGEPFEQMIRDVAVELLDVYGAAVLTKFISKRKLRDVIASMLQIESLPYRNPKQYVQSISLFLTEENLKRREPLRTVLPDVSLYPDLRVAASTLFFIPEQHWTRDTLRHHLSQIQLRAMDSSSEQAPANHKLATKQMYKFLRWALLGGVQGPDIPAALEVLGRQLSETRLREAIFAAREVENESSKAHINTNSAPSNPAQRQWQAHRIPEDVPTAA